MKRSQIDFTKGPLRQELILFSLPLIAGNLLQQLYNWVDTLIVGRFLGSVALAAVGSAYTLMVLLTSLLIGLCLGSGVVISQLHAGENDERMKLAMTNAFALIAVICLALFILSRAFLPQLILLMRIPAEAVPDITAYLSAVLTGLPFVFLYNYLDLHSVRLADGRPVRSARAAVRLRMAEACKNRIIQNAQKRRLRLHSLSSLFFVRLSQGEKRYCSAAVSTSLRYRLHCLSLLPITSAVSSSVIASI